MNEYTVPAVTVIDAHLTVIEIARSQFITRIARADTVDDARSFISSVRADVPHANHHVYAFATGSGNSVTEGASDDGEPSGTAGPPTLAVVRGSRVGDIVLVTSRIFGGTRLGTGGLVRAYTDAAQTALATLPLMLRVSRQCFTATVAYAHIDAVQRLLATYDLQHVSFDYGASVTLAFCAPVADIEAIQSALLEVSAGAIMLLPTTGAQPETDS